MNKRIELRSRIPHGCLKKIASRANVSPKSVTEYFSKNRKSKRIEAAVIAVLTELKDQEKSFNEQVYALTS